MSANQEQEYDELDTWADPPDESTDGYADPQGRCYSCGHPMDDHVNNECPGVAN